jgi:exodeoxyribonuclease III
MLRRYFAASNSYRWPRLGGAAHARPAWLGKLDRYMRETCNPNEPVLLCGDFNVAPEDRDVHGPDKWRGQVLFHPDERAALARICGLPLRDALRLRHEEPGMYTWWDYRMGAFHRGWGLRIDLGPIGVQILEILSTEVHLKAFPIPRSNGNPDSIRFRLSHFTLRAAQSSRSRPKSAG